MSKPLNHRQLKFVERFLATGNATQAYLDARYSSSRRSAEANAARLMRDPRIQELLKPARAELVRDIEISRERIRIEMARLAFVSPKAFFHPDGSVKQIHELDADTAAALASFEVEETVDGNGTVTRTKKFRLWDKNRALSNLADTEPGVWAEDAKGRGDATNMTVNITRLSDEDLDRLDALLALCEPAPPDSGAEGPARGVGEARSPTSAGPQECRP